MDLALNINSELPYIKNKSRFFTSSSTIVDKPSKRIKPLRAIYDQIDMIGTAINYLPSMNNTCVNILGEVHILPQILDDMSSEELIIEYDYDEWTKEDIILMSEQSLAKSWLTKEEDDAWGDL